MMTNSIRNIAANIPSLYDGMNLLSILNFEHEVKEDIIEIELESSKYFYKELSSKQQCPILQPLYDPVALYTTTCQSPEIKHIIENIIQLGDMINSFFSKFLIISKNSVDKLSIFLKTVMYYYTSIYFIIFFIILSIITYISNREIDFIITLFLSLPEQVASDIFRSGGIASKKNKNRRNDIEEEVCSIEPINSSTIVPIKSDNLFNLENSEINKLKDKVLTVESLDQFSIDNGSIIGTGIKYYFYWFLLVLLFSIVSLFTLSYYVNSINEKFYDRSLLLCHSALRFADLEYSTLFASEFFYPSSDISLVDNDLIYNISTRLLNEAINLHNSLTYGNNEIEFDFREYSEIEKIYIRRIRSEFANVTIDPFPSISNIQHDGYKQFGFDTLMRLYFFFLKGILENFKNFSNSFYINDGTWQHFHHIYFGHLVKDSASTNEIYYQGVSLVITESLYTSILFSSICIIIIFILFFGPIRKSINAIKDFIFYSKSLLSQIPIETFIRSIYINKWIKGEINRNNFENFEANYKRSVSTSLQSKIIEESPERVLVFDLNGQFIPTFSLNIKEPTFHTILETFVDFSKTPTLFDSINSTFSRFIEAKDEIGDFKYYSFSPNGNPIKVTIKGIPFSELEVNLTTSFQKYYYYIVILIKDISKEDSDEKRYNEQKQKTIELLSYVVPYSFAKRMHDGERRITFSAGIGSVLLIQLVDFEEYFTQIGLMTFSNLLTKLNLLFRSILQNFSNVSLLSNFEGQFLFISGLFNDEQNGRTEAIDMIEFSQQSFNELSSLFQEFNLTSNFKFSICTGGPIFCRLLMDSSPISLVSGDPVLYVKEISKICKTNNIFIERTTYECIYGISIEVNPIGEFEFNSQHTTLYSINLEKNQKVTENLF